MFGISTKRNKRCFQRKPIRKGKTNQPNKPNYHNTTSNKTHSKDTVWFSLSFVYSFLLYFFALAWIERVFVFFFASFQNNKLFVFQLKPTLSLSLCAFLASENQQTKRLFEQDKHIENVETRSQFFRLSQPLSSFCWRFLGVFFCSYDILSKRLTEKLGMVNIETTAIYDAPLIFKFFQKLNVTY